jgi:pyridoxine 4-dehydrogenase
VNRIGFGAMRLAGRVAFGLGVPRDRSQAIRVLRRAVELGVNHIDTAAFYGSSPGAANELINVALSPYLGELLIATKVRPERRGTSKPLRAQVEDNLRQLGLEHLDLVYLRVMDSSALAEEFAALSTLREIGLIRHLGVSGVTEQQLNEASAIAEVVAVQNRYGVGVRRDDAVLQATAGMGIAFVPFFSIAGEGKHHGPAAEDADDVRATAKAHGVSPAQVRIAWTLQLAPHVLAIPGTGDPDHLEENIAAGRIRLTDEEMARLSLTPVGDR